MAPTFGRSISFPLSSPARSSSTSKSSSKHVRSTSLPSCRAPHPLLAHLHTQAAAARAWSTSTAAPSSGLARIAALHAALADLLRLPEPQAAVRASAAASDDRLLHAFLLLADAHRGFQEALLALRGGAADARAALRRRDATALAAAARSRRRTEKEIARIAADVARCARQLGSGGGGAAAAAGDETEMAAALADAVAASAAASAAVFSAVASMSAAAAASSSSSKRTATTFAAAFAKTKAVPEMADVAPEKLEELERCIDECDSGSEMVFRSIVQTRVTLLNICTPAI